MMRLCQHWRTRYVDSQVGVPWDLMKTYAVCPHERGDSYNIISIQAS